MNEERSKGHVTHYDLNDNKKVYKGLLIVVLQCHKFSWINSSIHIFSRSAYSRTRQITRSSRLIGVLNLEWKNIE